MKRISFLALLFLLQLTVKAQQCRLAGNFKMTVGGSLKLLLLSADGHYDAFAKELRVSPKGAFDTTLNLSHPQLALLRTKQWEQYILLTPNRNLFVSVDTFQKNRVRFSGKAALENTVVQKSILSKQAFFTIEPYQTNAFAKMNFEQWEKNILAPIEEELAQLKKSLTTISIPDSLKKILLSEACYKYQNHLRDFANNYLSWGKNPERDRFLDKVMQWQPMPDSMHLISGFYANMIVKNHAHYQVNRLTRKIDGDTTSLQTRASNFLGLPFPIIDSLIRKYGEEYFLSWLYARRHLSKPLQEKMLVNKVMNAINNADFEAAFALSDTLNDQFTNSLYKSWVRKELVLVSNRIKQTIPGIYYREAGTIHNLKELAAPYKGKVVYIDIWGTWCGPCKDEMAYVPALKKQFTGKDVVFFYLDMDELKRITTWKNYVTYLGLKGEHYHMTNEEIKPIWNEIQEAGGDTHLYPSYLLIDRDGKLVSANAKRPSDEYALYQQIEKLLQ